MAYLIGVKIKVADFETWKASFDGSVEVRKAAGEISYRLFRMADAPNNLVLLCEWDTADNAKAFAESGELREAQEASGVVELPEVLILEEVDTGSS